MTVALVDNQTEEVIFDVNFWHYRTIVEAIRSLRVLPDDQVDRLHEPFTGAGLTKAECQVVAAELRSRMLPALDDDDRLLFDGKTTKTADDGVFYKSDVDWTKNYSTTKTVLLKFVEALEKCDGFEVC